MLNGLLTAQPELPALFDAWAATSYWPGGNTRFFDPENAGTTTGPATIPLGKTITSSETESAA
jgi:hypothetical protein